MKNTQTADILRPKTFDDIVGQPHLFGERGVLRRMIEGGRIPNMIFYGPPGVGKTTAAEIIAANSGMSFHRLNATTASLADVKEVISQTGNLFGSGGILLYLDEIQYFNRKQQQSLLEYIEDGRVTLIASTTENPHFYVYNAIISRSSLFEFKPVSAPECARALARALRHLNTEAGTEKTAEPAVLEYVARCAGGDVRRAINLLENAFFVAEDTVTREDVDSFHVRVGNFDDDTHYDLLSCLQKSIRGSDPDAAVFYVAKLLELGELISVCRRLQVIASEDVGLAYPLAAAVTRACCESAKELGMPEARLPLANAAILLATSPKSNSAHDAVNAATEDVRKGLGTAVPPHLQSPLFKGYKYPHDYPNHYVRQQYLPDDLKDRRYYAYGPNKNEAAARAYAEAIGSLKQEKK
ncbi:MAG: replication-associated recombination protein A [Clostridia bacterium]|nr:replication-associated recombination protein A [Clostridia bacterium]